MSQFSIARAGFWELSFWLVFDSKGGVRLTRGRPQLARNERGMAMSVKVPYALFKTPTLQASLTIEAPEPMVPPIDLTAAATALKEALGVDIDIRISQSEEVDT